MHTAIQRRGVFQRVVIVAVPGKIRCACLARRLRGSRSPLPMLVALARLVTPVALVALVALVAPVALARPTTPVAPVVCNRDNLLLAVGQVKQSLRVIVRRR